MNDNTRTTLKVIAAFFIGFTLNYAMTFWAAPGYLGTAMAVGVFLTAFGFIFAKFAMEAVMLPIAVISLVLRLTRGEKIKAYPGLKEDKFDFFGRVLFIGTYGLVSAITGIFIGALAGGMGWFTTSALFGVVGILLVMLFPHHLIWDMEGGSSLFGENSPDENTDIEQARKEGNPSVLFADKVAKTVIDAIIEKPDTKDKS